MRIEMSRQIQRFIRKPKLINKFPFTFLFTIFTVPIFQESLWQEFRARKLREGMGPHGEPYYLVWTVILAVIQTLKRGAARICDVHRIGGTGNGGLSVNANMTMSDIASFS
jgi:hypothetical protein